MSDKAERERLVRLAEYEVGGKLVNTRETLDDYLGLLCPPQPATGYQKNVTPRGPVVRPEDAFPESCCEGSPCDG